MQEQEARLKSDLRRLVAMRVKCDPESLTEDQLKLEVAHGLSTVMIGVMLNMVPQKQLTDMLFICSSSMKSLYDKG
jgi:hypothetical protein